MPKCFVIIILTLFAACSTVPKEAVVTQITVEEKSGRPEKVISAVNQGKLEAEARERLKKLSLPDCHLSLANMQMGSTTVGGQPTVYKASAVYNVVRSQPRRILQ